MWEVTMWMRCCAACRRVLRKARLGDHIRCECGWEWSLQRKNIVEYYDIRPKPRKQSGRWVPPGAVGEVPHRKQDQQ